MNKSVLNVSILERNKSIFKHFKSLTCLKPIGTELFHDKFFLLCCLSTGKAKTGLDIPLTHELIMSGKHNNMNGLSDDLSVLCARIWLIVMFCVGNSDWGLQRVADV